MTDHAPEPTPAIELRGIVKRFPGVVANDGVNLTVLPGTIHAIVGENGSGKSTLMKTLYGAHRPDEGDIVLGGETVSFKSPRDAIARGIGMVFQHFMLADNLTVWENIVLGHEPGSAALLNRREARRSLRELGFQYAQGYLLAAPMPPAEALLLAAASSIPVSMRADAEPADAGR